MSNLNHNPDLEMEVERSTSADEIFNLPLKRIKNESGMETMEQSEMTDTKKYIKVEEFDIKTEKQESKTHTDTPKHQMQIEELYIKPEYDISDDENCSAELDRAVKEEVIGKEHRKADKGSFICYHCNSVINSKKDLIFHISVGSCRVIGHVKKIIVGDRFRQSKEYICIKCHKVFKSKSSIDDHVIRNHEEFMGSISSKLHECKHCSYKTTRSFHLARHMEKHPGSGHTVKLSPCIHCDKIFKSKTALDDHIIKNHVDFIASVSSKIHQCKHCTYKTTDSSLLSRHMSKHPESGSPNVHRRTCIHCMAKFNSKMALDDHVIKNHEEFIRSVSSKIHQCKYCNYKTTNSSLLTRHIIKHPESGCNIKPHLCIHCAKTFASRQSLDDHIIKNHAEFIESVSSKIHECRYCSYKTTSSHLLATHMEKHPETECERQIPCIYCKATFNSKIVLDDHVVKNHEDFIGSEIHQCMHCCYKTTNSSLLARHTRKYPEFGCSVKRCKHCDKTFKSKKALDDHVIKNHEEYIGSISSKIHQCVLCSYKTTRADHLASHMAKHPESSFNVKQILCIHCDKSFKSKKALDDHVVKNHEEFSESISTKIHKCYHCSYKTTISYNIARHMMKHPENGSNVKLNLCNNCDKTFKSKKALDDHIIKNHDEFIGSVTSKIHQCTHCSYKTTNSSLFSTHMVKHP